MARYKADKSNNEDKQIQEVYIMLTSITPADEKLIKKFIKLQNRGPFRHLNDKECSSPQSEYIVKACNNEYKNIYQCAVAQAWLDVCRSVSVKNNKKNIEHAKEVIANMLQKYYESKPKNAEAFEGWYDSLLSDSTKNTKLTVGQAQKIINMSFKYLFCCADIRNSKMSHFTWCHMPLDSVTLEWLGMKGLVWNSINDSELYSMITKFARQKANNSNLLLNDFEIWNPKK